MYVCILTVRESNLKGWHCFLFWICRCSNLLVEFLERRTLMSLLCCIVNIINKMVILERTSETITHVCICSKTEDFVWSRSVFCHVFLLKAVLTVWLDFWIAWFYYKAMLSSFGYVRRLKWKITNAKYKIEYTMSDNLFWSVFSPYLVNYFSFH